MKKILVAQAVVILVLLASCGMGTQSEVADSEGSSLNVCENGWVQSIVPENGATEIGLSSDIIITAKEGVDISFIDDASIIVSDVNGDISGEVIKDPETNTIKFSATDSFSQSSIIFIAGLNNKCVTETAIFTSSFSTIGSAEEALPYVLSITPANEAIDVGLNTQINIYFSEDIDPASIDNILLLDSNGNQIDVSRSYDDFYKRVVLIPAHDLSENITYTVLVVDVFDMQSNRAVGGSYVFTTGVLPDLIAPSNVSISMKDNTRATIEFAAPGDDDVNGKAARYEFRYSTMPIEDDDDFETATPVGGFPLPLDAGTNQEFIIPSLEIRDYYIAIKAYDEAGNISGFEDLLIHVMPDVVKVAELSDNRAEYDNAAKSIVGGCDINNDGYDDVIVGAPLDDASGADTGKAYVYLGTSGVIGGDTASADIVINGIDSHLSSNNDYFGNSVSCGDFNGDGFDDIVIGANLEDTNNGTIYSANSGAVYMFYGAENIAANIELNALDADVVFQGRTAANQFGRQIAMLGDINQDGKSDLGVLEPYGEYLLANEGIAYVFYGDDYLSGSVVYDSSADFIIIGEAANAYLTGIIPAGDIDGDGILDLALSIVNNPEDLLSVRPGSVYILLGKNGYDDVMHVETRADMIFRGEHNYAYLGGNLYSNLESAMSMNGDINSDGIDDLIISSPEFDVSGIADAGMVYVFFGRGNWDGVSSLSDADMNIAGRFAVDKFGTRVDANGDFNNDGIDDLLVTAPGFDNGLSRDRGGAFVFYGHSGINGSLTWQDADVIIGRSDGISHDVGFDDSIDVDYIGQSGGFVGDINNDGYDDIAIGSPYADLGGLRDVGALYIIR